MIKWLLGGGLLLLALILVGKALLFPSSREYSRLYPEKIKGVFLKNLTVNPDFWKDGALLKENLSAQEKLGINTYPVFTCYQFSGEKFVPCGFPSEKIMLFRAQREIAAAKRKNLAVVFSVAWGKGGRGRVSRENLQRFFQEYKKVVLKNAFLAEKMKVEFFSLNEPDFLVESALPGIGGEEKARIINDYKEMLLPELRKVFRGKIFYQIGHPFTWDFSLLDVQGLDFFGVLVDGSCEFSYFQQKTKEVFSRARALSQKSGLPWIISELWINKQYPQEIYGGPLRFCSLQGKRGPYFQYVFQQAAKEKNLKGIIIDSWNFDDRNFSVSLEEEEKALVKSLFEKF